MSLPLVILANDKRINIYKKSKPCFNINERSYKSKRCFNLNERSRDLTPHMQSSFSFSICKYTSSAHRRSLYNLYEPYKAIVDKPRYSIYQRSCTTDDIISFARQQQRL